MFRGVVPESDSSRCDRHNVGSLPVCADRNHRTVITRGARPVGRRQPDPMLLGSEEALCLFPRQDNLSPAYLRIFFSIYLNIDAYARTDRRQRAAFHGDQFYQDL